MNELEERHNAGYCEYDEPEFFFCENEDTEKYWEETEHGLPF